MAPAAQQNLECIALYTPTRYMGTVENRERANGHLLQRADNPDGPDGPDILFW